MKYLLKSVIMLLALSLLVSCAKDKDETGGEEKIGDGVRMKATVENISDKIEVTVIEGEYGASGVYWVITADETVFVGKDGERISRSDIKVGDTVEIRYGGQVMMSYPPQIVAAKMTVV